MKSIFTFLFGLFFKVCFAQIPSSFFLSLNDQNATCYFTNDNIYFVSNGKLIKTDYSGNILWTKNGFLGSYLVFDDHNFYCLKNSSVFKADTSGYLIWSRDISVPVYPSAPGYTNNNAGLALHKDRIYISSYLFDFGTGNQGFNSILTLDTSGNVLNSWSDSYAMPMTNHIGKGFGALQSGSWFVFRHGGVGIEESIIKIDYGGSVDTLANSVGIDMGISVNTEEIISLKDSNYLAICNTDPNGMFNSMTDFHLGLSKFNEMGNVFWQKLIWPSAPADTAYTVTGATSDSSGNIYITGHRNGDLWAGGNYFLKMDSNGAIQVGKTWKQNGINTEFFTGKLFFRYGYLCCFTLFYQAGVFQPGVIYLDSTLSACAIEDTLSDFPIMNDFISNGSVPSYPVYTYTMVNGNDIISQTSNPIVEDLCLLLKTNSENMRIPIEVFPNPFFNRIKVVTGLNSSYNAIIYNLMGQKVYETIMIGEIEIDLHEIPSGVYQLVIIANDRMQSQKMIKF
jgi:hypothetical protein